MRDALPGSSPDAWATAFLGALHEPVTPDNIWAIRSWEIAESGNPPAAAMWNPLNTTVGVGSPGETWFNTFGPGGQYHVLNFATEADGIAANVKALTNGLYGPILSALGRGTDPVGVCVAVAASPWGTERFGLIGQRPGPVPPPPPAWKVHPMFDPPLQVRARLRNPGVPGVQAAGWWEAYDDGLVDHLGDDGSLTHGGMSSPADAQAFKGRHVAALLPRTYGKPPVHGYTIVATSAETYVPTAQHG